MEDKVNGINLSQHGYKYFFQEMEGRDNKWYKGSYQKRFDDKLGKKFFITINEYDYREFHTDIKDLSYSCRAQFKIPVYNEENFKIKDNTANIEFFIDQSTTIKEMEKFYNKTHAIMGCGHYERWGEIDGLS